MLNAAYNYPAIIKTRCSWQVTVDASFIYWQPIQENLEMAIANSTSPAFVTNGFDGQMINMDFDYKPGFKVGLGGKFDYDNWDAHAEYTWFHNTNSVHSSAPTGGQLFPMWGAPAFLGGNVFTSANEHWRLKMDILDVDLGRWYYVGTKLVFRPNFGLRAAWIRQNLKAEFSNAGGLGAGTVDTQTVSLRSKSWALGPKTGLDSNWLLGYGFRLFGNGEADLLYTRYTRLSFQETHTAAITGSASTTGAPFRVKQRSYGSLKTHIDLELGIGWGMYWSCNGFYTDIALGYEFQAFFDQNMFRHFSDDIMFANSISPNGNLYVHGLTATFRFDF